MSQSDTPVIASSDVLSLFPSLIWQLELSHPLRKKCEAELLPHVYELREAGHGQWAPDGGWQSGVALHEHAACAGLMRGVDAASPAVLRFLNAATEVIAVTGCWANINPPGAAHPPHKHPNNFLSGVYYLRAEQGADAIAFHDPRPQAAVMRPPVTELTRENTDQVLIPVKPGRLLIFPAWLEHSVGANDSDHDRVSVSFNLMFPRYAETIARPMWGEER